ncbi:MAG: hypothetical protein JEZ10_02365 [Verrucomicrobia bacterium]|nr:hypothetical protein [Verrucomicrobiota bacterium]
MKNNKESESYECWEGCDKREYGSIKNALIFKQYKQVGIVNTPGQFRINKPLNIGYHKTLFSLEWMNNGKQFDLKLPPDN